MFQLFEAVVDVSHRMRHFINLKVYINQIKNQTNYKGPAVCPAAIGRPNLLLGLVTTMVFIGEGASSMFISSEGSEGSYSNWDFLMERPPYIWPWRSLLLFFTPLETPPPDDVEGFLLWILLASFLVSCYLCEEDVPGGGKSMLLMMILPLSNLLS